MDQSVFMNVFEKIQERLTLIEVIEDYTPVITRGGYYVAKCPFHNEKTPSFTINNEKGVYYCFGCMATGNMFSFVCNIDNISKKEALEKLALKAGVTLDVRTNEELDKGLALLDTVATLYQKALQFYDNTENYVSSYIKVRKLTSHIISQFRVGYAPNADFLIKFLQKNNISLDLAVEVGLVNFRDNKYKDKFVDRIMIPITNEQGKVIGFTGRVLPNDTSERPKYLNSPESKYFNKSKLLYGLNIAKTPIQKNKQCILVEGNMDVIAAHQYEVDYTIATQGTATTKDHIERIKRLNCDLILAFDNDNAGRVSELKIAKMAYDNDINVFKFPIADKYKDIDEYLNHEQFELIKKPYIEYYIDNNPDLTSPDLTIQKNAVIIALNLTKLANPITQAQTLNLINAKTHLDIDTLKQLQSQEVQQLTKPLPEIKLDPMKVAFYQLLALDGDNQNLPIIYEAIKHLLDYSKDNFEEFIVQEEIKWSVEGERQKYIGLEGQASVTLGNLIHNIHRAYGQDPKIKELLKKLQLHSIKQ
jgi:DNA primase catalytic core